MKNIWTEIKELCGELKASLLAAVKLKIEEWKLRLAIMLSDLKQKAYNKRYFVVLMTVGYKTQRIGFRDVKNKDGSIRRAPEYKHTPIYKLRSINNDEFKYCKRKGWLPKNMNYLELQEKAFYQTDLKRNNSEKQEERQRAKLKYLSYQRKINAIGL